MNDREALHSRPLPDGRWIDVVPLTYGRARLCISRDAESTVYDAVF